MDTPGHADFGGEVERILSMVDGCVLLVDAEEGTMPQTKFVLSKALALGLQPIVVLNKVDRPNAEPDRVLDEAFDLFSALGANEEQLDFPALYASGKQGWADTEIDGPRQDLAPLFETILARVPEPETPENAGDLPFTMLATTLEADPFLGRILTGRIVSGRPKVGQTLKALSVNGKLVEQARLSKVLAFRGLGRQPVETAEPGDIVAVAGFSKASVSDTICDPAVTEALPARKIDPPTLSVTISPNDSPLAGREGDKVQSRVIRERLFRQAEGDVAIRVTETPDRDAFEVAGRGELQLGVLIETMRREGFELSVSRPRVLLREEGGRTLEPIEEIVIDVDEDYAGAVIDELTQRRCDLLEMKPAGGGKTRLVMEGPARALIGYHDEPCVQGARRAQGPGREPAQRRPRLQRFGHGSSLRAVEPRGARHDVHRAGRARLRGHDHRREREAAGPRREPPEGEAADQHPRRRQGRRGPPDPAAPHEPRAGDRLHRRRRARGSDAEEPAAEEAAPRPERAEEGGEGGLRVFYLSFAAASRSNDP